MSCSHVFFFEYKPCDKFSRSSLYVTSFICSSVHRPLFVGWICVMCVSLLHVGVGEAFVCGFVCLGLGVCVRFYFVVLLFVLSHFCVVCFVRFRLLYFVILCVCFCLFVLAIVFFVLLFVCFVIACGCG